jgi:branched-chain amino acid transport system substrate-binding protein
VVRQKARFDVATQGRRSPFETYMRRSNEMSSKSVTRREFLRGAAVTGVGLAAAACGAAPTAAPTEAPTAVPTAAATAVPVKESIRVGMSRPLSGWNAVIGDSAFRPIYETWVKQVNDAGGVQVAEYGKKLPIELIVYDDKSDVATMTRLTEKLILEDKVDFLWPASGTSFIFGQAPIANKYGYVLITAEGGATQIRDMLPSLPFVFVTLSFSDWYQLPVLAELVASKGAKTAYISYIADLHGIEYSGIAGIEFPKHGIEVVGLKSLPPDIKDLSPVIKGAQESEADLFCCFAYPDQNMPAVGTAMELGYNPKAWIGGPGVNFGFYHTAFGPAVEGLMGFASFARGSSPKLDEMADTLYAGKPEELQDWWGHPYYWAGLDAWKAAIETAGTLDQEKIRDVIASASKDNPLETVLGPTWFENGLLAKDCHPGEIGQWINGVFEVVGPAEKATAEFVYPKPPWPTG